MEIVYSIAILIYACIGTRVSFKLMYTEYPDTIPEAFMVIVTSPVIVAVFIIYLIISLLLPVEKN